MARDKKSDTRAKAALQTELPDEQTLALIDEDARTELLEADAFAEKFGSAYDLTGQIKAFGFSRKIADVSGLILIRQMKESKLYKGMRVAVEENGKEESRHVRTFAEYCEFCLGLSVNKVDEDLQNLAVLGEEFYAATQKMGLTYRQLRALRAMPIDERDEVKQLAETKDYDALKDILYQQMDETEKIKKEMKKRDDELQNKDSLYNKAVKKQHEAEIKLEKFTKLTVDEQILQKDEAARDTLKELHTLGLELMGLWAAYLAKARAVFDAEPIGPETPDMLTGLTSALCAKMADDLQETGLEVDFRRTFYPDHLLSNEQYAKLRGDACMECPYFARHEAELDSEGDVPTKAESAA